MGHPHTPAKIAINDGAATYINLGSWAEEESDDGEATDEIHRAARTHLLIHRGKGGPTAEFLAWDGDRPRHFSPPQLAAAPARQAMRALRRGWPFTLSNNSWRRRSSP